MFYFSSSFQRSTESDKVLLPEYSVHHRSIASLPDDSHPAPSPLSTSHAVPSPLNNSEAMPSPLCSSYAVPSPLDGSHPLSPHSMPSSPDEFTSPVQQESGFFSFLHQDHQAPRAYPHGSHAQEPSKPVFTFSNSKQESSATPLDPTERATLHTSAPVYETLHPLRSANQVPVAYGSEDPTELGDFQSPDLVPHPITVARNYIDYTVPNELSAIPKPDNFQLNFTYSHGLGHLYSEPSQPATHTTSSSPPETLSSIPSHHIKAQSTMSSI